MSKHHDYVILDPNCSQIPDLGKQRLRVTRLGLNCVSILTNVTHEEAEAGCEAVNMSLWSGHSRSRDEVSIEREMEEMYVGREAVITAIMDFRNYLR